MIIWRGLGLLVPVIVFACSLAMELALEAFMNNDLYYQENSWSLSFALAVAAGLLWLIDRKLNEKPAQVLIDKESGEEVAFRKQHDFFFLKFTYWVYILLVLAVLQLFLG